MCLAKAPTVQESAQDAGRTAASDRNRMALHGMGETQLQNEIKQHK